MRSREHSVYSKDSMTHHMLTAVKELRGNANPWKIEEYLWEKGFEPTYGTIKVMLSKFASDGFIVSDNSCRCKSCGYRETVYRMTEKGLIRLS